MGEISYFYYNSFEQILLVLVKGFDLQQNQFYFELHNEIILQELHASHSYYYCTKFLAVNLCTCVWTF